MVMKQLYINGVGTGQFDIYISSDTFLNSPEIAYEAYEVPSLDGSLLKYDKRLNNVARRFDCFCKTDVDNNIDAFKKLLYTNRGYMRIESDYEPNIYQYGYLAEGIEFTPFDQSGAYEVQFSVYFSCKPQKYYKNSTLSKTLNSAVPGLTAILPKSDSLVQSIMSQLPSNVSAPTDDWYEIYLVKDSVAVRSLGYYTAMRMYPRNSFIAVYALGDNLKVLSASDYGDASSSIASTDETSDIYAIVGANPANNIFVNLDANGNWGGPYTVSADLSSYNLTASESAAIGSNLELTISYKVSGTVYQNAFYLETYYNNQQLSHMMLMIDFDSMDSNTITALQSIATSNVVEVVVNTDYEVYATDETTNIDLSRYARIYGDMEGICDKIIAVAYVIGSGTGSITKAVIETNWWKL